MKYILCVALIFVWGINPSQAGYNYDYLEVNCTSTSPRLLDLSAQPSTYGFVRPTQDGGYPQGMDCSMVIKAPKSHYLIIKFRRMEIYQPENSCTDDYVMVSGNTSSYKYCGYRTPSHSLISTTDTIEIRFVSNSVINENSRIGFELYYTSFHRGACMTGGSYPVEFQCRSGGRCIPRELKCDSLDNCGDWSDERATTCGLSQSMTICVSIVCVLVFGTCAAAVFMCVCSKKSQRQERSRRNQTAMAQEASVGYNRDPDLPPAYQCAVADPTTCEKPPLPPAYENYGYEYPQTDFASVRAMAATGNTMAARNSTGGPPGNNVVVPSNDAATYDNNGEIPSNQSAAVRDPPPVYEERDTVDETTTSVKTTTPSDETTKPVESTNPDGTATNGLVESTNEPQTDRPTSDV